MERRVMTILSLGEMLKQIDAHHAKTPRPQP
jgi:hypothetical protein